MTITTPWVKQAVLDGKVVKGLMVSEIRTPSLGAILDAAGADFVILDQEHGAYGADLLADMMAGFRGGHCNPLVRVPDIRKDCFLTPLELGACGVVVPRVETAAEAEAIVRFCTYPPRGERGVSMQRAHSGYRRVKAGEYMAGANNAILIAVQIETAKGVENVKDILAVPGVDMAFIGPSDLSVSCGISPDLDDPAMAALIDWIVDAAAECGKLSAIQSGNIAAIAPRISRGLRLISTSTDLAALIGGMQAGFKALDAAAGAGDR